MAAPPVAPFRVRFGAGAFQLVRLAPGMSAADVKEAVALATGLAGGTVGLRSAQEALAKTICQRQPAKDSLPKTICRRQSAKDSRPKRL